MEIVMKRTEKYFERKADQVLNALFGKSNLILLSGDTVLAGNVVSELRLKADYDRKIKTPKQNKKTIYNHKLEVFNGYDIDNTMYLTYGALAVVFIERFDVVYQNGDVNIAIDALKDKDIKVVLTSNKSRKEVAHLLKNRTMKTIEVNHLERKASKRTAANKEAIEAFDAVETFSDEIPFPEVEKSKEIEETGDFVESFLEDLITAPFKSEIIDLKEELYSVEYKLKNTKIALESSDELLRSANKMIERLKNEVYNLSMDCSNLIVQKNELQNELQERNQNLKQELDEMAEISSLGDALLDEAKSLIDKLEHDNNGLNDVMKAQQLYIENLENDKRTLMDDYEYISLDNLTLQSEIISLKRNLEERDNKVGNLFAELNSILKKNKVRK
ncbi:TPA: hypothetical protein N3K56_005182 [Klebsiella aerogenes]|nr:hypothetical protein [Klebsiella aerogenes]